MKKKNLLQHLPLVLLAAAIALSPSFSAGQIEEEKVRIIEIRIEDILLVILGLIWLANFLISGRKKIEKPPLLFPILAWLGIGFFSLLTNWIFMNIGFSRGFFYFLKEVEFFFLYFYLFYHIKSRDSVKFIVKTWLILGVLNILLVVSQFIRGTRVGAYGPGIFKERGPFPSGGFFLILFIFLFNVLLYYYFRLKISKIKKIILSLAILSLIIGVISSGSRTAILGLVSAVILSTFFYQLKQGGLKPFFIGLIVLLVMGVIFYLLSEKVFYILGLAPEHAFKSLDIRIEIWERQLVAFLDTPFNVLFGLGKSVWLTTEESHNQYVRNFIETGIVGSLIFFILIFAIIKKAFQGFSSGKTPLSIGLSSGLLVATFVMLFTSIAVEGFLVVKPNEVYWFFIALTMAVLSFNKVKENHTK